MQKRKVFYLGFQRVGTKSFGMFMEMNGFNYASWDIAQHKGWPELFSRGEYESIIRSRTFQYYDAFSDGPWFQPELVKYLYSAVENSVFVMLTRVPGEWFKSMISLNAGLTVGDLRKHCELYGRMDEYEWLEQNIGIVPGMHLSLFDKPLHYMEQYTQMTEATTEFLRRQPGSEQRFFRGAIEDPDKFRKIADFLGIDDPLIPNAKVHSTGVSMDDVKEAIRRGQEATLAYLRELRVDSSTKDVANEDFVEAVEAGADHYGPYLRVAGTEYRRGRLGAAERLLRRGISLQAGVPKQHVLLSKILERRKQFAEAVEEMRIAIASVDDYGMYHYRLGTLLQKCGRQTEALAAVRRSVELAPGNDQFRIVLGKLERASQPIADEVTESRDAN